jgi:hypothetical protein
LGAVEEYSAGVVHRHEQTLSGPKKDRLELLRHTRAHFGQIFMLYPDAELAIDRMLDQAAAAEQPVMEVKDEDNAVHRVWKISDPAAIARIQALMADKKLLIADGHHRYETALAYRNEDRGFQAAQKVMMTFVNTYSPGLEILATHRVLRGLSDFRPMRFANAIGARRLANLEELKRLFQNAAPEKIRIARSVCMSGIANPANWTCAFCTKSCSAACSASPKKRCESKSTSNTCEDWTPRAHGFAKAPRSPFYWSPRPSRKWPAWPFQAG